MKRIGIAASKIAKGNLFLYNIFVVIISSLFSALVFFLSAFSIIIALVLVAFISSGFTSLELTDSWHTIFRICMGALALVVGLLNIVAVLSNGKLKVN